MVTPVTPNRGPSQVAHSYRFRRGHSGCVWTPGRASCPQVEQNVSLLGEDQNSTPLSGLTCLHTVPSRSSCISAVYTRACRVSSRLALVLYVPGPDGVVLLLDVDLHGVPDLCGMRHGGSSQT
jgi:hypothetical protein